MQLALETRTKICSSIPGLPGAFPHGTYWFGRLCRRGAAADEGAITWYGRVKTRKAAGMDQRPRERGRVQYA